MSSVPAARQALQIVKYLASQGSPVRASTISRDLDLPRSTTYHLMRVLQEEGFVIHSPENQAFALSSLLSEIGSAVLGAKTLARLAQPILAQLVAETKLPIVAHLGVLEGTDVLYASKVSATRAPALVTSIGVRLPAHLTATGRAMLACLSAEQLKALYPPQQLIATRTGPEPTSAAHLDQILAETKTRGWAMEDGDITVDYGSVAAAVFDHNGYPAAAVGLTFRGTIVSERQWAKLGQATLNAATVLTQRIRGKTQESQLTAPDHSDDREPLI